jgi:hypothetical protein
MATTASRLQLGRRLRLVKLLRAHGLRHAERLREDELKAALDKLPLALGDAGDLPSPSPRMRAPASEVHKPLEAVEHKPAPEPVVDERWDDPYAAPRFLEPKVRLPEGNRTFLRLIAVDERRLLITWDLSEATQARALGGVKLRVNVLNDERDAEFHDVDLYPGRWYIPAPGERLALEVALVNGDGEVLATSNPAIVPPSKPAPDGELIYATLPVTFDRRRLASRDLLDEGGDFDGSEDIAVESAGTTAGAENPAKGMPTSASVPIRGKPLSGRVERTAPAVSPSSHSPSSHSVSSHSMPSSSSHAASSAQHAGGAS